MEKYNRISIKNILIYLSRLVKCIFYYFLDDKPDGEDGCTPSDFHDNVRSTSPLEKRGENTGSAHTTGGRSGFL